MKTSSTEYLPGSRCLARTTDKALGITDTVTGKYVTDIAVLNGAINVTYGEQANLFIKGKVLSLRPRTNINGDIAWVCGTRSDPPDIRRRALMPRPHRRTGEVRARQLQALGGIGATRRPP